MVGPATMLFFGSLPPTVDKPVLLLAVLDLIADGQVTPDAIPWSSGLRDRFEQYFRIVQARDDQDTPQYPFRWLQTDGIWTAAAQGGDGHVVPLEREPLVRECDTGKVHAALAGGLERFVLTAANRTRLRNALVERFFADARPRLEPSFRDTVQPELIAEAEADDDESALTQHGSNQGFRRKVFEIYDHQCTACGLRINIPDVLLYTLSRRNVLARTPFWPISGCCSS